MKPILVVSALLCSVFIQLACTKRIERNRTPSALEEKLMGKWSLTNSAYAGYWEFKSKVVDSLSTRTKTVRELEIHIPGFCAGKGYWSLTNDSVLDNSCVPMARVIKLTNDSLTFRFSSGWFSWDYLWKR